MTRYRFDEIAFNSTEKKKPVEADKEHYIGLEHLDSDSLEVRRWGSDVAPTGEKLLMKKGDVLFGKRRAYQKKVAIAPFDGIFSAHGMVLRPKEEVITKEYFPFFIKSDYFLDAAIKISVGSLSPTINWKDLQKLEFDLPPLEEQKRLADILWAAEENRQKCMTALDKLSQYSEAILNDKRHYTTTVPLSEIAQIIAGQSPEQSAYNSDGVGMPFYQGKVSFGLQYIQPAKQWTCQITKIAEPGDILMSIRAPVGPVNISAEKCCIGRGLAAIRADERVMCQNYLFYILRSMEKVIDEKYGKGSTFRAITKKDLESIPIPRPNIDVQNEVCSVIDLLDNIVNLLSEEITQLEKIEKCLC